jgi:hypothetical protein
MKMEFKLDSESSINPMRFIKSAVDDKNCGNCRHYTLFLSSGAPAVMPYCVLFKYPSIKGEVCSFFTPRGVKA